MIIDIHSHILPGIDDGSKNIEESVALLDRMADDGVGIVVATPHFYCFEQDIDSFISKRNEAYKQLSPYLKPNHPKIILGAEVLYSDNIINNSIINQLKIEGTDYILLEMPYTKLTKNIIDGVSRITDVPNTNVIIAHAERYLNFTDMNNLLELMQLDVVGQINCSSLVSLSKRRNTLKLFKYGYAHILGTDTHRIERNDTSIREAENFITKKFSSDFFNHLMNNALNVLNNKDIDEIIDR